MASLGPASAAAIRRSPALVAALVGLAIRRSQEGAACFGDAPWRCLTRVEVASLGPATAAAIWRSPARVAVLVGRAMRRSRSLGVHAAVESIVGLDRRLILLFWHLAEHWG